MDVNGRARVSEAPRISRPRGCTADEHPLGWLIFPRSSAVLGKDLSGVLCTVSALSPGMSSRLGPRPPTDPPVPLLRSPSPTQTASGWAEAAEVGVGVGEGLLSGVRVSFGGKCFASRYGLVVVHRCGRTRYCMALFGRGHVAGFILGSSKITADGDYSHEIKRYLFFCRKVMTNLAY